MSKNIPSRVKRSSGLLQPDLQKFLLKEHLLRRFPRARTNFIGLTIERSPEQLTITLHSNKPGILIGVRGEQVKQIREECIRYFGTPNLTIKIEETSKPPTAQIYADEVARMLLEGKLNPARISSFVQMDIRAQHPTLLGSYIKVAGKFRSGGHARTTIYRKGEMKYSGNVFNTQVEEGVSSAVPSLGKIGVVVRLYDRGTLGSADRIIFRKVELPASNGSNKIEPSSKPKRTVETISLYDTSDATKERQS